MVLKPQRAVLELNGAAQQPISAPEVYDWDVEQGDRSGRAHFWFSLPALDAEHATQAHALFLPRVGNQFRVRLDGRLLREEGTHDPAHADTTEQAYLVELPWMLDGGHELEIEIHADAGLGGGLGRVYYGTYPAVKEMFDAYQLKTNGRIIAIGIASLVFGLLGLTIWLLEHDSLYFWYGAGELLWALQSWSQYASDSFPLAYPWSGAVFMVLLSAAMACILRACFLLVGRLHGPWLWLNNVALGILPLYLLVVAITGNLADFSDHLLYGFTWIVLLSLAGIVVVAWQKRDTLSLALLAPLSLVAVGRLHDTYVGQNVQNYGEDYYWFTTSWVAFGVALAWLIAWRLAQARRALQRQDIVLRERLQEQQQQLETAFARERTLSVERAALRERQRILQDMHDGLGSELHGALMAARLIEQGETLSLKVSDKIQRSVEQLKLSVDAMQEDGSHLVPLLLRLRNRMDDGLRQSNVEFEWDVLQSPQLDLGSHRARELQLLLYEAFTNLLTHAKAHHARLRVWLDVPVSTTGTATPPATLHLVMEDDGVGCAPESMVQGHGLRNMRQRAERMGATLSFERGKGDMPGLRLHLAIPLTDDDIESVKLPESE